MSRILVIVPVLNRPQNAKPLVDSLKESGADAFLMFVCWKSDWAQLDACFSQNIRSDFPVYTEIVDFEPGPGDYARKIQFGYERSSRQELVLLAADDLRFHGGWLEAVERIADEYDVGVIGTNDQANPLVKQGRHATHPVVRRCYIDTHGGVVGRPGQVYHEGYDHQWCDVELVQTAMARGCYAHAHDAIVRHVHPLYDHQVEPDDTYRKGQAKGREDRLLFESRRHLWEVRAAPSRPR